MCEWFWWSRLSLTIYHHSTPTRHPPLPQVPGHEIVGIVTEVGANVSEFKVS